MIAQFYFLLQIVAPVFVVMALGYLMRKIGILSGEADRTLTRLVVTLLAPSLAFDTIIGNGALAKPANWILPPVMGFGSIVLGIAVSRWGAKLFRVPEGGARRTFVFTTSLHNYGYIPLPLCNALFDRDTMGVLFVLPWGRTGFLEHCGCAAHRPCREGKLAPGAQPSDNRNPHRDFAERHRREGLDSFVDRDDISSAGCLRDSDGLAAQRVH